jgi:demethylmenaquinone methyltransferase / 2-methoxy-6-polyprenyl-1,4-benzoquinol methylase
MNISNPESEWFGFRRVKAEEKTGLVRQVFSSVANRYDLMNDLMSGGLHRLWKDALVRRMNPEAGMSLLDVAGGTGDIALRLYRRTKGKAKIIVCDINPEMLEQGKAKALDQGIVSIKPFPSMGKGWVGVMSETKKIRVLSNNHPHPSLPPSRGKEKFGGSGIAWIEGNAEKLPFDDCSVDMVSIAFGLRNVTRIDQALREAARVLKPGGRFFCMEFSPGVVPMLKPIYDVYCENVLPVLGEFVAHDRKAYQYLAESIQKFPPQAALAKRMEKAGLACVKWTNLTGGIVVIHEGWKV